MADNMDRGLDEIIADTRPSQPRNKRNGGGRGGRRDGRDGGREGPRDGIRKSHRDEPRNLDSEWVHDRYDDHNSNYRRGPTRRPRDPSPDREVGGVKIRVDNVHYDLTENDLDELFRRIGPVVRLQVRYDRAGRSLGTAFVTYESQEDASEAIAQFDGANANGQPIRLSRMGGGGAKRGNPFDSAVMPGRPLSERITAPGGRARSHSPSGRYSREDAERKGIDRYVPGDEARSRTPPPPRRRGGGGDRGGRRPGARRERATEEEGRGARGNPRPKKTQEELDAEMEDYFGGGGGGGAAAGANDGAIVQNGQATETSAPAAGGDDIDMIE